MQSNEKQPDIHTKRLFTDVSTLASSAIGGAFAGAAISSFIVPGAGTLIGAAIGGIGGATLVNLLSKHEYNGRKSAK